MAYVKKLWTNRVSEYFNRYRLEDAKTGEISNAYINLNDGAVEQAGDKINADTLNDLENRIEAGFESSGGGDIMIAGTEASSTSEQAYTVGQYLIYNKLLYKVISAIAIGDTLTVGTNIIQTKIADEVSNHLVVSGTEFYFDYQDSKFGYNTNANRGADTFHPFSDGEDEYNRGYADGYAQVTHGTVTYTYHHHATSGTDIHVNDDNSPTGGVADDYHSSVSAGCFTQVVYKAHSHKSSCYSTTTCYHPSYTVSRIDGPDGEGYYDAYIYCPTCGQSGHGSKRDRDRALDDATRDLRDHPKSYSYLSCGKTAGVRYPSEGVDYYTRSCGITNGQLVSALITY